MTSISTLVYKKSFQGRRFQLYTMAARSFSKEADSSLMDTVGKMRSKLGSGSWESLWKESITPWDLGKPTPLLVHELAHRKSLVKEHSSPMRTLVPGCGAGYDLVTLAKHHHELAPSSIVVGLDIAPTSLIKAEEILKHSLDQVVTTKVELVEGDFFESPLQWTSVHSTNSDSIREELPTKYDFILDYTFFAALPPSMRADWGRQMARLLHDDGILMTIVFPILPDADPNQGPPYPVSVHEYRQVLNPHGVVLLEEPSINIHTVPSRAGKEMVCYWKREQVPSSSSL